MFSLSSEPLYVWDLLEYRRCAFIIWTGKNLHVFFKLIWNVCYSIPWCRNWGTFITSLPNIWFEVRTYFRGICRKVIDSMSKFVSRYLSHCSSLNHISCGVWWKKVHFSLTHSQWPITPGCNDRHDNKSSLWKMIYSFLCCDVLSCSLFCIPSFWLFFLHSFSFHALFTRCWRMCLFGRTLSAPHEVCNSLFVPE